MATIRFEHFLSFLDGTTLDQHLEEYRRAGFFVADHTVRHEPGLRTGFLFFGVEYLEFCWVEDEALYAAGAGADPLSGLPLRQARRPYSIGLISDDVAALHEEWRARGLALPAIERGGSRDDPPDAAPRWAFAQIPDDLTPGARCFALSYLRYPTGNRRKVHVAPNTTYAVAGITFVSEQPGERATRWRELLAPGAELDNNGESARFELGPHTATWLTPRRYREEYGLQWQPASHPFGEIALFHLLATDLEKAHSMLSSGGRTVVRRGDRLLVLPDPCEGFTLVITARLVEEWYNARTRQSGELLDLLS